MELARLVTNILFLLLPLLLMNADALSQTANASKPAAHAARIVVPISTNAQWDGFLSEAARAFNDRNPATPV